MKKRDREEDDYEYHSYPSTGIPPEVHQFAVKLFNALKAKGIEKKVFLLSMKEAGYEMSERTFNRHIRKLNEDGNVLSINKNSGSIPSLSYDQKMIAAGFIFKENSENHEIHEKDYKKFIKLNFNIDISLSSSNNYLHEAGFSSRAMATKTSGYKYDSQTLIEMYWNWIHKSKIDGTLTTSGHRLCSIDFVFTSHRTTKRTSFALMGGPKPRSSKSISKYTNCVVTCVWADGVNRTKPMLFTLNPAFRFADNTTPAKKKKLNTLLEYLKHYRIDKERIEYIGSNNDKGKTYVRESPELIRRFFNKNKIPKYSVALTDGGNAFFDKGTDILLELGFESHEVYPAAIHQYLSPNDNRLHGTAKQSWKQNVDDFANDVNASLYFLHCLDVDTTAYSRKWFTNNLISPTTDHVNEMIGIGNLEKSSFRVKCIEAHDKFISENNNNI